MMCKKLMILTIFSFILCLILAGPTKAADPNLAAYWKFDEGSGTTAFDKTGNGNDGVFVGDPKWVTGKLGGALEFNGDDYLNCGNGPSLQIRDELTMAFWFKVDAFQNTWEAFMAKGDDSYRASRGDGSGNATHMGISGTSVGGGNGWFNGTIIVTDGQWHHYAATYDGTAGRIYIDGVLDVTSPGTGRINQSTYDFLIGENQQAQSRFFNGLLDEVRLYNRALTEVEILDVMAGAGSVYPLAYGSNPANGVLIEDMWVSLSWQVGDFAVSHNLYFGTNFNDVNEATVDDQRGLLVVQNMEDTTFSLDRLNYGTTYYWRIDEVNDANLDSPWKGDVWSFTTANYIVLEDFESYSDESPNEIWNTWIDGFGTTTNGSTAGYPDPDFIGGEHFVETGIVHGGNQSMPVFYDNRTAGLSEVTKTLTSLRDWTVDDVITLTLFYYGDAGNTTAPMYFAVNGSAFSTNDTAKAVLTNEWTQWDIPMQVFADQGVNLNNVSSMSIGFGDKASPAPGSGVGHVFFDDIRLSRSEPIVVEPEIPSVNPGTANLQLYYAFENNVQDTSGKGNNAIIAGNPTYVTSATGYGSAIALDGTGDYLTLPIGQLLSTLTDSTFAVWVNWTGDSAWQRIFDFGSGEDINMFLTPNAGNALRFAITTGGNGAEEQSTMAGFLTAGWHHIAVTIDPTNTTHTLYLDGRVVAQKTNAINTPSSLGVTTQNWMGLSQYPADPYYVGSIDEFRIYNKVLTRPEVLYLAGK